MPSSKVAMAFRIYDLFVSMASMSIAVLLGMEGWSIFNRLGAYGAICSDEAFTPRLELVLKLNLYLTCYQLLDTVFLVLLRKSITVFHIYHHITVILIAFIELDGRVPVYWVAIFFTSGFHAITYFICYLGIAGSKPRWLRYIKFLNLLCQKMIIMCSIFAGYNHVAYTYLPQLPHIGSCAGTEFGAIVGIGITISYVFFPDFMPFGRLPG